jgi:hypothetical protein
VTPRHRAKEADADGRRRDTVHEPLHRRGLGLQMPDGNGPIDTRVLNNMWIDDIAFGV